LGIEEGRGGSEAAKNCTLRIGIGKEGRRRRTHMREC